MVAWGDLDDEQLAAALREVLPAELDAIPVDTTAGIRAIRGKLAARLDRRVLASVRARPGRAAYSIARDLGIYYAAPRARGGRRVKHDGVLAALVRLEAAGQVYAETPGHARHWYPAGPS